MARSTITANCAELAAQGAVFHTDGDSEVILAAYQRWGADCVSRLSGMFAFAHL
jgi:asparagine synthase (glutamine-hydrolysing)